MSDFTKDLNKEGHAMFTRLYEKNFPRIKVYVTQNSGTEEDAEDIFQDALMVFVEKFRQDDFSLTASANTYVYAIAKNLWLKKLRDEKSKTHYLSDYKESEFLKELDAAIEEERSYWEKLRFYMVKISTHCRRLINDMFFANRDWREIQAKYGYKNKHTAANQKYKCLEQIRKVKYEEEN